jgi:hypothetical protein
LTPPLTRVLSVQVRKEIPIHIYPVPRKADVVDKLIAERADERAFAAENMEMR